MQRILFVDDEPSVLQGLDRGLRPMRNEWEMEFVESGARALELLSQKDFDVIVSDIRMPGMDGAELLTEVARRYPQMVRMVLSAAADRREVLERGTLIDQYVLKPCDTDMLSSLIKARIALSSLRRMTRPGGTPAKSAPAPAAPAPTDAKAPLQKVEPVDVNLAIRMAIARTCGEWQGVAEVETELDETLDVVPFPVDELPLLMINFIINAAHSIAAQNAGKPEERGKIRVKTKSAGAFVEAWIFDSGTSIAPGSDPFAPGSEFDLGGPGPWLRVAHRTVEKQGGTLTHERGSERGATFLIRLPRGTAS